MSQSELLKRVIELLDLNHVEYMVTGSVVSSSQGQPRATHDIDLVVNITPAAAMKLVEAFQPPDYYLDEFAVREAITRRDMFNLLNINSGDKVDFWVLQNHPYDQECFRRRTPWELGGVRAFATRPEDTIIQKLRWAELSGGSEKQFGDVKAVYELQYGMLDMMYIENWTRQLGLTDWLDRLKREAKPLT